MSGLRDKLSAPGAASMDNANRRQFLKGTAATVATTSIGVSMAGPATSLVKTISHGEFSITVLSDGHLTIPTRFLARNARDADIKTAIGLLETS
jgi:TAT (twin-arginine translocation) pathway signal sequence